LRAVCFVARLANMHWLFVAPRFAHPIPQSQCATLRDLFRGSLVRVLELPQKPPFLVVFSSTRAKLVEVVRNREKRRRLCFFSGLAAFKFGYTLPISTCGLMSRPISVNQEGSTSHASQERITTRPGIDLGRAQNAMSHAPVGAVIGDESRARHHGLS
jgi:hypothetical protein